MEQQSDWSKVNATSELSESFSTQRPTLGIGRHAETSVYPYLETNIDASVMEFSQEPIPHEQSAKSIARHGTDTPFRPWQTIQRYVEGLVYCKGYQDLVSFNTTVEPVTKVNDEWVVVLRRADGQTVHYEDGSKTEDVDAVVIGTGYSWTLPFLPQIPIRNNRVPDLYLRTLHQSNPTLVIIGAVAAGLTFKVFEWQSVLAARVLAGRAQLPPLQVQKRWEEDRIKRKGDSVPFTALFPDFEEYFETVRKLPGEPGPGQPGKRLSPFDPAWPETFLAGHQRRIQWWKQSNEAARERVNLAQHQLAKL